MHAGSRGMRTGNRVVAAVIVGLVTLLAGTGVEPAGAATPATVSVGDVAVTEGDAGLRVLEVPVGLSDPQPGSVTVSYTISPGSASTPADYLAVASGTVTFSAGQVMRHLLVRVKGDTDVEGDETVLLTLTAVSGGPVLGRANGTVTILDDDPTSGVEWSVGDARVVEGDAGTPRRVEVPVTINAPQAGSETVWFTVLAGSATAGVDYAATPVSGTLTMPAGQVRRFVTVRVLPDGSPEIDETLTVNISSPSTGVVVRPVGTVTIFDDDGATLYTWGRNSEGQLGDGTVTDRNTPTQIGAAGEWTTVSGGANHTCARKTDGTLWCWGYNLHGQLGNGTNTNSTTPVQVGTSTDWAEVDAGANHTCARKTDGTLWCWGWNLDGQLGNGTNIDTNTPVQVGVDTDWVSTATGRSHTCARKTDGTLWCWGWNFYGQLGNGSTMSTNTPVQVGAATDWSTVAGGRHHTCAVKTGGTLWCWGRNTQGQLGNGTNTNTNSPVQVGVASDWATVSAGVAHTCATRQAPNRTLWCWGLNGNGQLGDGTTTNSTVPVQVGAATDWAEPAAAGDHTCARRTTGTMWCFGRNLFGTLGDGSFTDSTTPVQVGTATDWVAVAVGTFHSAGLRKG